jgi:hypothetical protein
MLVLNPRGDYAALGDVAEIRPVGLQANCFGCLTVLVNLFVFCFFGGEGCMLLVLLPVDGIGA